MKGKITNVLISIINIVFGVLIMVYTYYIPQDIIDLTVQELSVTSFVLKAIYVLLIILVGIDSFQYYSVKDNKKVKTGYLFGIFTISFLLIKTPEIGLLPIISGVIVFINTLRDNSIDIDSTSAISVISVIGVVMTIVIIVTLSYSNIGQYIKNKENENAQKYKKDYFMYITELGIDEPYINIKVDGKCGYITPDGNKVIDFKYDYASPFINIVAYNKNFQVALVSKDGMSYIIMKNERQVMSYMSESSDEDYDSRIKELEDIYKNTLEQGGEMCFEIEKTKSNIRSIDKYDEIATDYTYRYDYNDENDIIVSKSNFGYDDKFELARKDNIDIRVTLDCRNLDYDENHLYLYSNEYIPFFDVDDKEQGWFTRLWH